jgi:sugar fermentation stimulation protein A
MKINNIISGTFQERPNRFTVLFETERKTEKAHLRDPGRLKELLIPGTLLLLRPADNLTNRKTKYDVMAVWKDGVWVLINSGLHSDLAAELIESGLVEEFLPYSIEKREYTFGNSRIDFLLSGEDDKKMLLEVKGCTLVEEGLAKFPDAPTLRGKRHVEELIKAKEEGFNSAVLFLIMRDDAVKFGPNWEMDPEFSSTLKIAWEKGVKIIVYSFEILLKEDYLEIKPLKSVNIIV